MAVPRLLSDILESLPLLADERPDPIVSSWPSFLRQEAAQDEPRGLVDAMQRGLPGAAESVGPPRVGTVPKREAGQPSHE